MALGKIRRWNARKSGDGSILRFRRSTVIFLCDFNKAVSAFRRWLWRKSELEPQDVARRLTAVGVWILGEDAVDQAEFL